MLSTAGHTRPAASNAITLAHKFLPSSPSANIYEVKNHRARLLPA